jgi:type IV secretion system protein VirB8
MMEDKLELPAAFDEETRHRFAVESLNFQQREVRRSRRVSLFAVGWASVATVLLCVNIVTLSYTVPSVHLVPLWIYNHPDGTVDVVHNQSSLPEAISDADKRAWLWQYVKLRESYVWPDAHDNYDVVSAMSAPDVRDRFQAWYNDKIPDAPGPVKSLGKDGVIQVKLRDSDLVGDIFTVRYCRYVELPGQRPVVQPMIAKLHFQTLNTVTLLERIQYNPGALIVTSYPGAYQQGTGGDPTGDCGPMGGF